MVLRGAVRALTVASLLAAAAADAAPARDVFLPRYARSYYPGRSGQIMIVPREGHYVTRDEPANVFMHGSPWGYDTRVPLILHGAGVRRGRYDVAARHQEIAPTIASIIGLPVPATMTGRPLSMAVAKGTAPPRLVLLLVLDGFRADYLDRHAATLPTLSRLRREGATFPRAQIDYLPSATSVAHATIATGAGPAVHGIVVNTVFDHATGKVSDPFPDRSPRNLMAPTLADAWAHATDGRSVIATQGGLFYAAGALAGRGACQTGGRPVFAAAYETRTGSWVTNAECYRLHPSLAGRTPQAIWESAQGVWRGHDITGPDLVRRTSLFAAYEVDAAISVLEAEPFGADEVTDLLLLNLKTPDFLGHTYGPDSPEIAEGVAALDLAIGRLLAAVEKKSGAGRSLVVVTADHGMPALPHPSRKHIASEIVADLNARLDPEGKRVIRMYEASNAQMFVDRARLRELGLTLSDVRRHLESLPFVFAAYTEDEVRGAAAR